MKGRRCPVCVYISLSGVCAGQRYVITVCCNLFSFARIISLSKADFQSLCVFDVEEGEWRVGGCFLLSAPDSIPSGQPRVCPSLLFFMLHVNKREEFPARGLIPLSSWPGNNRNLFTPKIAMSAISRGGAAVCSCV